MKIIGYFEESETQTKVNELSKEWDEVLVDHDGDICVDDNPPLEDE